MRARAFPVIAAVLLLGGASAGRLGRGPLLEYGAFIVLAGLVFGVAAAGR